MAKPWVKPDETIPPADAVHAQMLQDYPESALGWMRQADWEGPFLVPLGRIDFTDRKSWRAWHEPAKVKRFAQRIQGHRQAGKPVKPVVLLHVPGRRHLVVIDGHHRALAYRRLGEPVNAWIGTLHSPALIHEAEESHDAQKAAVTTAGLAVHAASTGRLLLLQRANDPGDPASGCWEFPGGHLDPGEKPEDAARREWAEETGLPVPDGLITGRWTAGVYAGFILTIPHELPLHSRDPAANPDDPQGLYREDLAWWHPDQLAEAMLRPELAATLGQVLAALAPLAKQGSVLDYQLQQAAAEHARDLTSSLGAAVNAGLVANAWLARHPQHERHRRPRHHRRGHGTTQRQRQQPVPQQRPAPRHFLNALGVTHALTLILARILADIWGIAWTIAAAAAAMLLGLAVTPDDRTALAQLEHDGDRRLAWILQTRLSRLERVLLQAHREGWDATRLADAIRNILENLTAALLVTGTEAQWAAEYATLWAYRQAGITHTTWVTMRDGRVCGKCRTAQAAGPWPLGKPFPGTNVPAPPAHPRCRCHLQPAKPPAKKSAETPELEATPHILGPHGLWHTPDRHTDVKQKLPNYIEHIATALMRDQGLSESQAIAYAINAVKRWAKGDLHWGKGHVTPEVQQASQRALDEWEQLKASHHG